MPDNWGHGNPYALQEGDPYEPACLSAEALESVTPWAQILLATALIAFVVILINGWDGYKNRHKKEA